ncbi:uncharacterized protein [Physcomitrium patens]|uniref:uncharacterized protein isoform X4 n=1 Tax=Physcomitrium patens TaxID=3218 RepID=UPI000D160642|nr:protein cereblon-like isoform X4 [Physcomitrium patens]|eukprot:XP_024378293.1 protein cereblon-like isoform X4 [Physcomitrella patens]
MDEGDIGAVDDSHALVVLPLENNVADEGPRNELLQMQRIRELDMEPLEEEADSEAGHSLSYNDSSSGGRGDGGGGQMGGFTFDTNLASMHTYLGEVDDVHSSRSFADGGALLTLPMFYLEGIVLFPEDTLPLRVLQPRFKAAVDRAMRNDEALNTIGVIHVRARDGHVHVASIGTTAEIRQLRHLTDGSINVVTKGRQRFRVCKAWTEADGALFAQVQIIEEKIPLHVPRDAFSHLAAVSAFHSGKVPRAATTSSLLHEQSDDEAGLQADVDGSDDFESDSGPEARLLRRSMLRTLLTRFASESTELLRALERVVGEDESSERERLRWWFRRRRVRRRSFDDFEVGNDRGEEPESSGELRLGDALHSNERRVYPGEPSGISNGHSTSVKRPPEGGRGGCWKAWAADAGKWRCKAQRSAWPYWVYRQFDAYDLARRAADMLRQMAELPRVEAMVRTPSLLSYYIASNMPLQDATRQELLEVDGTVYRLRREIELLESMDQLRCKRCLDIKARRSEMLVMSAEGPISAYVNAHGYVHETLTLQRACRLVLAGQPQTANSWFPGYAWALAECSACTEHMGWRFTAVAKETRPKAFWGIRRSQLADNSS